MPRPPEGIVRRALEKRARHGVADLLEEVVPVRELDLARIAPNPRQPRRHVDAAGIEQLARSIAQHGLLQPIVVRAAGQGFELVAGSRRLRAVESLGRPRITALVLQDGDTELLALIENLQRADLDPIDEAEALLALKENRGLTLETMQQLIGKSVSTLSESMSLLRLPPAILGEARALAAEGQPVPRASLVELARIKDEAAQLAAWQALAKGEQDRAGVRAVRREAATAPEPAGRPGPRALGRRLDGLAALLARTQAEGYWREPDLRTALLTLRRQIDRLLEEPA